MGGNGAQHSDRSGAGDEDRVTNVDISAAGGVDSNRELLNLFSDSMT